MSITGTAKVPHGHWIAHLIEGVVLVILGVTAILIPPFAALAVETLLGWLLIISGILGLITTFWKKQAPGFWWSLILALFAIAIGITVIGRPITVAISLITFFVIKGIFSILFALNHHRPMSGRWVWLILNGIVDLLLAIVIVTELPGTATWVIGFLLGVDMGLGGIALINMALHVRGSVSD